MNTHFLNRKPLSAYKTWHSIYKLISRATLQVVFCICTFSIAIGLSGCGKGQSSDKNAMLVFEEFQPENQGRFQPVMLKLNQFEWHKSLTEGSYMEEGKHYIVNPKDFPKGLTFQIRILDRDRAELSWVGSAFLHHVNESKDIPLTFTKEAFWADSEKAFTVERKDWTLRLQYGKGYSLSGSVQSQTSGALKIKELSTNGIISIDTEQDQNFTLPTKLEDKEPYTLQIVEHPAGQCCYLQKGDGITHGQNIDDLQIQCQPAQLNIPQGTDQALITTNQLLTQSSVYGLSNVISADILPDSKVTHNKYGDGALVWQANVNNQPAKFVSVYNTNTNQWNHPLLTAAGQSESVYSNGLQAFADGTQQATIRADKGVNVSLAKENTISGGANLAQFTMGNPNHLLSAQSLNYDYSNYEFTQQDNGLWNKTVLKEGNKRIVQLFVDGSIQNVLVIRYNLLENFDPNRNQYNPSEQNFSTVIARNDMQSDFQPFIDAKVDPLGHGIMVWTAQKRDGNDNHQTILYAVEIENHRPKSSLSTAVPINDHPLSSNRPQIHVDENGNMLLVWVETYHNGTEPRLVINKQEKNNKFPIWNPLSTSDTDTNLNWSQVLVRDVRAFPAFALHTDMNQHGDFVLAWTEQDTSGYVDLHGMLRRFYDSQSSASIHSDPNNTKIFDSSSHSVDYIDPDGFDVRVNDQKTFVIAFQAYDNKDITTGSMSIPANIHTMIATQAQDTSISFGTHGLYEDWQTLHIEDNNVEVPEGSSFVNINIANNGSGTRSWYQIDPNLLTEVNGTYEPVERVSVQLVAMDEQSTVQILDESHISLEEAPGIIDAKVRGIMDHTGCGVSTLVIEATTQNGSTLLLGGGSK